jgi:hypothetical protein
MDRNDPKTALFHLKKAQELETGDKQKEKIKDALEELKKIKD